MHALAKLKHDLLEDAPLFDQRARAASALAVVQDNLVVSIQRATGGEPSSSSEGCRCAVNGRAVGSPFMYMCFYNYKEAAGMSFCDFLNMALLLW